MMLSLQTFLREVSRKTLVIVDEAYLEYIDDVATRSAVDLVHQGANVALFHKSLRKFITWRVCLSLTCWRRRR